MEKKEKKKMRRRRENGRSFIPVIPKGQNLRIQRRLCFHDIDTSMANAFRCIRIAKELKPKEASYLSGFPDITFFIAFAEMLRRFWLLHCLGFSMNVSILQAKKNCSFLRIYMENVIGESLLSGEISNGNVDVRVDFMVVLGFKIGVIVRQSQVYLFPMITPPVS
ncbi:hypothetical protein J1N35_029031 [Gossypium stocksii]|uniref:GIL1/IRKI C-terminal domain-containing protein n=1 Tax=Gossypium stocksii TaxID=47602 RepID=A0A9D3ZSP2_9ROSI|nr:hypothetical protein J1N35_029031 [Gossypium stocksii]